jgi:agmatinase
MGLTGVPKFCGLADGEYRGEAVRYSVLPVPYDRTSTYVTGQRSGPAAILEASAHIETYDEELCTEPWRAGIETLPFLQVSSLEPEEMIEEVRSSAAAVIERGSTPVLLGGEHSVTVGAVKALSGRFPDLTVLQLDAHADLRGSYGGSPFNHACVARRLSELCPVVQVGTRSLSSEEAEFLKGLRSDGGPSVKTHYAADMVDMAGGGRGVDVTGDLSDDVYISIDLDVFDPSIMPATGTPEPGGLGWYEVLGIIKRVAAVKRVVGFDIVELCPIPGMVAPDFLAARLGYKMMGYINEALDEPG